MVKFNFRLLDNIDDIIFGIGLVLLIKFSKHLFELEQTDKFVFAMKLINTSKAT